MIDRALNRRTLLALGALALASPALAQGAVSVPIQIIKGKIFIDVTVDGRPVQAMIDSGASYSGIDVRLAEDFGIVARGRRVALRHVQGSSKGRWADGVRLRVGGETVSRPMLVTDFGLLTASILHPVVVLLGADFLGAHVAQFDFDAGRLTLHARAGFTPPAGVLVPLARPRGLSGEATPMTAPVVVEGVAIQALVDTGSQSPLIVSPSVARRLDLLEDRLVSTSPIGGIGGTSAGKITSLKTFAIGRQAFMDVPVQVTARSLGRIDANLGLEVLSRFNLWLDLAGGRMWLAARADQPPFARNLLGVFGIPDGDTAIRVTFVATGSPADQAGIEKGDIITLFNGKPANTAQVALADAPAGTPLTLTLENGQTRRLVLAPYY
jgi:predicted aspartyl protease